MMKNLTISEDTVKNTLNIEVRSEYVQACVLCLGHTGTGVGNVQYEQDETVNVDRWKEIQSKKQKNKKLNKSHDHRMFCTVRTQRALLGVYTEEVMNEGKQEEQEK